MKGSCDIVDLRFDDVPSAGVEDINKETINYCLVHTGEYTKIDKSIPS